MDPNTNEQPIVEAVVSIDYESYKALQRDTLGNWWLPKVVLSLAGIALSFFLGYVFSWLLAEFEFIADRGKWFWLIALILSALPVFGLLKTAKGLIDLRPSKSFQTQKALFEMAKQYAFYEDHLIMQMPDAHGEVAYAHYPEAKECEAAFYLKSPAEGYVQLPKKCFTEEQIAALRNLFARTFGENFKAFM